MDLVFNERCQYPILNFIEARQRVAKLLELTFTCNRCLRLTTPPDPMEHRIAVSLGNRRLK